MLYFGLHGLSCHKYSAFTIVPVIVFRVMHVQAICCVQFADCASDDEHNVGRRDGDFGLFSPLAELSAYALCAAGCFVDTLPAIILPQQLSAAWHSAKAATAGVARSTTLAATMQSTLVLDVERVVLPRHRT